MVKLSQLATTLSVVSGLASTVIAHPGEHHEHEEVAHELSKRAEHASNIQRSLSNCLNHPSYQALAERGQSRRFKEAQRLRQKRGIPLDKPYKTRHQFELEVKAKRDVAALEEFEELNHNMTSYGYTESTSSSTLFALYKNVSCILTPEVTYGPYYVEGEYIRKDVTEDQDGVPLYIEYNYIDVSTCEAATDLYLETWQANATGVYSGVVASGNGVGSEDYSNINKTFLRGIQAVDDDGVAAFETIFAGHYSGRATHIHLMTRHNGTVLANGTLTDSTISHVGQLFFPTDLKDAVEATSPYSTNTQDVTTNDEDSWAPYQAENDYDPFPDFAYLGDDISDGLLMWISIGIDMSADYTSDVVEAGKLTAEGGECNENGANGCYSGLAEYGTATGATGSQPKGGMGGGNSTATGSMGGPPGGSGSTVVSTTASRSASSASTTSAKSSTTSSSTKSSTSSTKSSTASSSTKASTTSPTTNSSTTSSATKSSATPSSSKSFTTSSSTKSSSTSSPTSTTLKTSTKSTSSSGTSSKTSVSKTTKTKTTKSKTTKTKTKMKTKTKATAATTTTG